MILAVSYADVVGTLGLVLALGGLAWQWFTRRTEPEQEVRIQEALDQHEARRGFLPELRSDVLGAMQFIEPEGWRPPNVLVEKCNVRFNTLYTDWEQNGHAVEDRAVRHAMDELAILEEIRWLDHFTDAEAQADQAELHVRLLNVKARLQRVLDAITAIG